MKINKIPPWKINSSVFLCFSSNIIMKLVLLLVFIVTGMTCDKENESNLNSNLILKSPQITAWGSWGDLDTCPKGSYVVGMRLKVEHPTDWTWWLGDNTALNAISFQCGVASASGSGYTYNGTVNSTEGAYGTWDPYIECKTGYAFGFQLRSERSQGIFGDNTAANNLRLYCAGNKIEYLEGNGTTWGEWTQPQFCPDGFVMCSLKTEVETWMVTFFRMRDRTGLNNLDSGCCKLPE